VTDRPDISVVIAVYNDEANLMECVESLQQQTTDASFEILVVEDGSHSALGKSLARFDNTRYFWKENGGPASARTLGVQNSSGEVIAFIDSDCLADKDWLRNLHSELNSKKNNIGIIGKITNYYDSVLSNTLHAMQFYWWGANEYKEVEVCLTGNSMFRKKDLEEVGLFGDFKYYGEDIDLGHKLVRTFGKKVLYSPKPEIRHKTRGTLRNLVRKTSLSGLGFYLTRTKHPGMRFAFLLRNRLLFSVALLLLPAASAARTLHGARKSGNLSLGSLLPVGFLMLLGYFSFWYSVAKEVFTNSARPPQPQATEG